MLKAFTGICERLHAITDTHLRLKEIETRAHLVVIFPKIRSPRLLVKEL